MDFLLALVPSLLWGSMGIALMKMGGTSRQQATGQLLGGGVIAMVIAAVVGVDTAPRMLLIAAVLGVVQALGVQFQLKAFHDLGVSRTMPITTGAQLIGISLLGILLFGEWIGSLALPIGLAGLAMVVAGVVLTDWTQKTPEELAIAARMSLAEMDAVVPAATQAAREVTSPPGSAARSGASPRTQNAASTADQVKQTAPTEPATTRSVQKAHTARTRPHFVPNRARGLIYMTVSTAMLILFPIAVRWFDVDPMRSFLPLGVGFLLVAAIGTAPRFTPEAGPHEDRLSKYTLRAMLPGVTWATGLVIMLVSQVRVGVGVGFALSQLGVVISTFGGILILGERRSRTEMKAISIGVGLIVVGAILLGVAKTIDPA